MFFNQYCTRNLFKKGCQRYITTVSAVETKEQTGLHLLIHSMALSQLGHVAFESLFHSLKIPNDTFTKLRQFRLAVHYSIKSTAS